jgi:hypothetical protein
LILLSQDQKSKSSRGGSSVVKTKNFIAHAALALAAVVTLGSTQTQARDRQEERQALINRHRALAAAHQKIADCLASATDISQCRISGSASASKQSQSLSSRRSRERVQELLSRRAPAQSAPQSMTTEERQSQSQATVQPQRGPQSPGQSLPVDMSLSRLGSAAGRIEQTRVVRPTTPEL